MLNADSREALVALSQAVGEPIADVGAWRRAKLDSEDCEVAELCVGASGSGPARMVWLPGGSRQRRRARERRLAATAAAAAVPPAPAAPGERPALAGLPRAAGT